MGNSSIGVIFSTVPSDSEIRQLEKDLGMPVKKIEKKDCAVIYIGKGLFKKKVVVQK